MARTESFDACLTDSKFDSEVLFCNLSFCFNDNEGRLIFFSRDQLGPLILS